LLESEAEQRVETLLAEINGVDTTTDDQYWARLDSLTKPPRSLGTLESVAVRVARIQQTERPDVSEKVIIVAAGDHGVVASGVSPYPQEVTAQMVANISAGGAAINQIAASVGARLIVADVGVAGVEGEFPGVLGMRVASGTRNMATGPAMTRDECARALQTGVTLAREAVGAGAQLVGTGEMGIGNTTAASALTSAFTDTPPETVVGPGTGLDADGVKNKIAVVEQALAANKTAELDPVGVLSAVGGLEIAALAGVVIGCAIERVPVVIDGFISSAAALAAVRIAPDTAGYIIASHLSTEPGHRAVLEALDLEPLLELDMRLGEGSGAALGMGVIDAACRVMSGMATFAEAGVSDSD